MPSRFRLLHGKRHAGRPRADRAGAPVPSGRLGRFRRAGGALLVSTLFFAGRASAAEGDSLDLTSLSLEELMKVKVVYTASQYEQDVHEAPASVTIVTSEEIRRYGYRTLADVLRGVGGFYTTGDRQYVYLGARGFSRPGDYNTRILLQVNGHRMNEELYSEALIGPELALDLNLVERVEVIRGPSSSVYGTNAFFGVINVITKKPEDIGGAWVTGRGASFDTYASDIEYGRADPSGVKVLLGGSFSDSEGQNLYYSVFDSPETSGGVARNADYDRSKGGYAGVSYKGTSVQSFYGWRKKGIPTAPWGVLFGDPRTLGIDTRGFISVSQEVRPAGNVALQGEVSYDWSSYRGDYVYESGEETGPPTLLFSDEAWAKWWEGRLSVSATLGERHRFVAGARGRYDSELRQEFFSEEDVYLNDNRTGSDWAVYSQDEIRIRSGLLLNAGVRHDHYETFGGTTNPRLALIANPLRETTCKLLYGSAFRAPNVFELYYTDTGSDDATQKSNPDLGPETIHTYEFVVEQGVGVRSHFFASVFHTDVRDLISLETDPNDDLLVFRNKDKARATGFELAFDGSLAGGERGRVSYTFQESEDGQTGERLTNSPKHLAKLGLLAPLAGDRLSAGWEVQYTGDRTTPKGGTAGEYVVTNLTLASKVLRGRLELSGTVYNLFDVRYDDPGSEEHEQDRIEQDGRAFSIRARVGI